MKSEKRLPRKLKKIIKDFSIYYVDTSTRCRVIKAMKIPKGDDLSEFYTIV